MDSSEKWILLTGTLSFLLYCSSAMVVPMIGNLKARKDIAKLFTIQILFTFLALCGLLDVFVLTIKVYYGLPDNVDLIVHDLYACIELGISWSRMPKKLFDKRLLQFTKIIFIVAEILLATTVVWHVAAIITSLTWVNTVAKWWNVISVFAFVVGEFNSFIQSRKMLNEMPLNYENFDTTRRVLEYLIEANIVAAIAGVYSIFYSYYGYLTLDCLAVIAASMAFKAYASVFAITSTMRSEAMLRMFRVYKTDNNIYTAYYPKANPPRFII
ncbi:hypothetical protein NEOLI_005222, partial [Neolecta irregularis DAH-3]